MIAWLKDIVSPIRRADHQFGAMRYVRDGEFWEGWMRFAPLSRNIEVLLSGSPAGPSDDQRAHLSELEARFEELAPSVAAELDEAALHHMDGTPREFVLTAVDLPAKVGPDMSWELVYETSPESWTFAVQMRGWKPQGVSVEC